MFGFKFGKQSLPYMEKDKTVYAPLQDGRSSSSDEGDRDEKPMSYTAPAGRSPRFWKLSVIALLLVTNITTFVGLFAVKHLTKRVNSHAALDLDYAPNSWARIDELPTQYNRLNWWTEYSDKNFTEGDMLWDNMNTAHGFIAMDRTWAKERHWPDSMHFPSDNSKNVYLLEAYHLLHCVGVIRKTFWEAVNRADHYTFNPPHSGHCLDMLRQYIVCKADTTPLYVFGDDTAGDEQYRKCNSWDALRQFATDNTACYRDTPKGVDQSTFPFGDHFGYCDGGYDGVKQGERRGPWKHGAVWDGPP
ncbi:uncharacterized protein LY89DRAFT_722161 [Mollisia scopiformis]|uniref:Uncharacterized protein n=1 Tax=Mollisia scopiformis TaxID=149040 RepID=A0A194WX71_MOLSC|nr:uncharacterized protein LY89DRAFT_722161 [Mollisia scopiformis]KUJ12586.1 hypothetical protein LY89DRAFT_722161 [Mollisia scopiformis]